MADQSVGFEPITFWRQSYVHHIALFRQIASDMADHGFEIINILQGESSAGLVHPSLLAIDEPFQILFECTPDVNANLSGFSHTWRVLFDVQNTHARMYVSTPIQLPDDCTVSPITDRHPNDERQTGSTAVGCVGTDQEPFVPFFDRSHYRAATPQAPMSYVLNISNRGFALFVYEETLENSTVYTDGAVQSWVVVQRPINPQTGEILTFQKAPLFALYFIHNAKGTLTRRFTVREVDISTSSLSRDATKFSDLENAWLPPHDAELNFYTEFDQALVKLVSNLHTARFRYAEQIDLIAYSDARLFESLQLVETTRLGKEVTNRQYLTTITNDDVCNGMVPMILLQSSDTSRLVRSFYEQPTAWQSMF